MVGLGGVLVEVLGDVAFALAPLGPDEARRLIGRLRGFPALVGARGREAVDLDALARVVCAVGDLLVAVPEVVELDLNPILATAAGCVAVDWRVVALAGSGDDRDSPSGGSERPPSSP
jgi:acetyltransferase